MHSRFLDPQDYHSNPITIFSDVEIERHPNPEMIGKSGNVDDYDINGLTVFIDGVKTKLEYYQVRVINGR